MFLLDMSMLEIGDILLTREKKVLSKGVRHFSAGDYSHAMLYVAQGSYIHSDRKGVHSDNIQRKLFKRKDDIKVIRVCDFKNFSKVCEYARNRVGTEYTIKDAIKSVASKSDKISNDRQFCSRLVAESYYYAGLKLVQDPHFCTPSELDLSPYVKNVIGCVKLANDAELALAKSRNPLSKQAQSTNAILKEARRITGRNIQNFQDLDNVLLLDDSFDSAINKIVIDSGYYDFISIELIKNSWRYNGREFLIMQMPEDKLIILAFEEIKSAKERYERYSKMYEYNEILCLRKNIKYFNRQRDLYGDLLNSARANIKAAEYVLKELGVV
jgi:hypothetical protein